jgi:hypothetical protein
MKIIAVCSEKNILFLMLLLDGVVSLVSPIIFSMLGISSKNSAMPLKRKNRPVFIIKSVVLAEIW